MKYTQRVTQTRLLLVRLFTVACVHTEMHLGVHTGLFIRLTALSVSVYLKMFTFLKFIEAFHTF